MPLRANRRARAGRHLRGCVSSVAFGAGLALGAQRVSAADAVKEVLVLYSSNRDAQIAARRRARDAAHSRTGPEEGLHPRLLLRVHRPGEVSRREIPAERLSRLPAREIQRPPLRRHHRDAGPRPRISSAAAGTTCFPGTPVVFFATSDAIRRFREFHRRDFPVEPRRHARSGLPDAARTPQRVRGRRRRRGLARIRKSGTGTVPAPRRAVRDHVPERPASAAARSPALDAAAAIHHLLPARRQGRRRRELQSARLRGASGQPGQRADLFLGGFDDAITAPSAGASRAKSQSTPSPNLPCACCKGSTPTTSRVSTPI